MPVKQVFESQDAIPEFLKSAVVESDGKWIFEAETSTEVAGLKSALERERKAAKEAAQQLGQFQGIDPEKARKVLSESEKAEQERLKAQGNWEAREKQLLDAHAVEVEKRETEAKRLRAALDEHLVEAAGTAAIAAAKGSPVLLLPHLKNSVRVVEENGRFVARVVDEHGNPRIGDAKGNPMTVEQLVAEMRTRPEFQRAFEATGSGGSGAPSVQGTPAGGIDFSKLSPTEKLKAARMRPK